MTPDDIGALLTRFAWLGAVGSAVLWIIALREIWRTEVSLHHLIARVLSVFTMVSLDVAILIFFWPGDAIAPIIVLTPLQARSLVAFIVGMQVMAALWQITAPQRPRARYARR